MQTMTMPRFIVMSSAPNDATQHMRAAERRQLPQIGAKNHM